MPKIVYYVAVSLDGYISGPEGDNSSFAAGGEGVEKYLADLKEFRTVIMGRKTYEYGYGFGLIPGQPAYPHMQHYIFSTTLQFPEQHDQVHIEKLSIERIIEIRDNSTTDVYLCGGGEFAGWLLDHDLIDVLKMKINPIILGGGVRIFGDSKTQSKLEPIDSERFENGMHIITFELAKKNS